MNVLDGIKSIALIAIVIGIIAWIFELALGPNFSKEKGAAQIVEVTDTLQKSPAKEISISEIDCNLIIPASWKMKYSKEDNLYIFVQRHPTQGAANNIYLFVTDHKMYEPRKINDGAHRYYNLKLYKFGAKDTCVAKRNLYNALGLTFREEIGKYK